MNDNMIIDKFDGEFSWLSNFYPATVLYDNVTYPSVENAYQAAKTNNVKDRYEFETCSAGRSKKLGRLLIIREDWNYVKNDVMYRLLTQKFRIDELRNKLIETNNSEIIEGNNWNDTYWGVCNGIGSNKLGKMIMQIRTNINVADFITME